MLSGRRIARVDRRVPPLRFLIAAAALAGAGAGVAAGAAGERSLQALVWIAPGHEAAALTRQPAACLGDAGADPAVVAGRALFNAPQLLGGQASRAGISCASCHSNGRRNPHFQLAGISDGPGTADVSASFFSTARANGRFDPKPIPDLALPGRISHDRPSRALEDFLRVLIVEEFSGRPPGNAALGDLAAYVRAVKSCLGADEEPVRMAPRIGLFRDSIHAAARAAAAGDSRTAARLTAAARWHLGLIDERLFGSGNARAHKDLLETSRRLQVIGDGTIAPAALLAVLTRFDQQTAPNLLRAEKSSLYRPAPVARWLARRTP